MINSPTRILLLRYFLIALISVYAQKISASEKNSLSEFKKAQDRLTHFINSDNKYEDDSIDDWLILVEEYLALARNSDDLVEISTYSLIKAQLNYDSGCFDSSTLIAENLHQNVAVFNTQMKNALLGLLDKCYAKLGLYDKQIAIRKEMLDLGLTSTLRLHDIYANSGYYNEAYKDFVRIEKRIIDEKNYFAQANFYLRSGNLLRLGKNYSEAQNHLEKALGYCNLYVSNLEGTESVAEKDKSKSLEGFIKANIGKCYSEQNDYKKAITFLKEAIILLKQHSSVEQSSELIESKIELAHCYLKIGNYKKTGNLLAIGLNPLTIQNKIRYNRLTATYFGKIGNAEKSLFFLEKNIRITDSLTNAKNQTQSQQLNALVGAEKENSRVLLDEQLEVVQRQKADLAYKDSRINKTTFFTLVMLLAFGGLFWAYLRGVMNQRLITEQKHYIQQALVEKDSMLKEIHHRVRNNLQIVSSLFSLQVKNTSSKEVIHALGEGQTRVKAMALIHQQLYQNEDISVIDMQGYIESLITSVQSIYKNDRNNININIDAKDVALDIDRAIPFGLILNELVSNSFKYAFSETEENGEISILLSKSLGKEGYFEYIDNGIGMPDGHEEKSKTSMGIRLIKRLANQLKSTLKIDNNSDGVRFYFSFS